MMAEAYTDIEHTMMYYGNDTHPGAHFPFNFQLISYLNNDTRAQELEEIIKSWYDNIPQGKWANWVVSLHLFKVFLLFQYKINHSKNTKNIYQSFYYIHCNKKVKHFKRH
jgi:hypothetical protein